MDVIEDNFHMDSPMVPLKQQVDLDKVSAATDCGFPGMTGHCYILAFVPFNQSCSYAQWIDVYR